jgi:hypothetical protein
LSAQRHRGVDWKMISQFVKQRSQNEVRTMSIRPICQPHHILQPKVGLVDGMVKFTKTRGTHDDRPETLNQVDMPVAIFNATAVPNDGPRGESQFLRRLPTLQRLGRQESQKSPPDEDLNDTPVCDRAHH